MWNTVRNLYLVLSVCCLHLVYANFISDKALRSHVNCEKTCAECFGPFEICHEYGYCTCIPGYFHNATMCNCIPCSFKPIESCLDSCCDGICNNNICIQAPSNSGDILLTATQIAMTGALILGILTIIALLWKMCSKTDYRRRPAPSRGRRVRQQNTSRRSGSSNTSVGSLQRDVSARLRDAPPPYIRSPPLPPPGNMPPPYYLLPSQGYANACFEGDNNLPPPDYSVIIRLSGNNEEENASNPNQSSAEEVKSEIPDERENRRTNNQKTSDTVLEGSSVHI